MSSSVVKVTVVAPNNVNNLDVTSHQGVTEVFYGLVFYLQPH